MWNSIAIKNNEEEGDPLLFMGKKLLQENTLLVCLNEKVVF